MNGTSEYHSNYNCCIDYGKIMTYFVSHCLYCIISYDT